MSTSARNSSDIGATVVITHKVREGRRAEYEAWLDEIAPLCKASPGYLDWHIVRPVPGLTGTYTVIIRFDTAEHLKQWMESSARARLIEKVQPLFVTGDDFFISSGLDFWFTPRGVKAKVAVRWKQYVVTWSAIHPLVLGVPFAVRPILRSIGVLDHPLLTTFAVTGVVVFLMVYGNASLHQAHQAVVVHLTRTAPNPAVQKIKGSDTVLKVKTVSDPFCSVVSLNVMFH